MMQHKYKRKHSSPHPNIINNNRIHTAYTSTNQSPNNARLLESKVAESSMDWDDIETKHYEQESFESYERSQIMEATQEYYQSQASPRNMPEEDLLRQQVQDQDQPLQLRQRQEQATFIFQKQQNLQQDNLSIDDLNKLNFELVEQIKRLRMMRYKYKAGIVIEREQQKQLSKLEASKMKALDHNYELSLEQQEKSSKKMQKQYKSSIKRHQSFFNKQRYESIHKSIGKSPFDIQQLINQISASHQQLNPELQCRLSSQRQHILNIRKQQDIYKSKMKILQSKERHYEHAIDGCNSLISRGNYEKLKQRKILLQTQIQNKRQFISLATVDIHKEMASIQHQIIEIDESINSTTQQQAFMVSRIRQTKDTQHKHLQQFQKVRFRSEKLHFSEIKNHRGFKEGLVNSKISFTPKKKPNYQLRSYQAIHSTKLPELNLQKPIQFNKKAKHRQKTTFI